MNLLDDILMDKADKVIKIVVVVVSLVFVGMNLFGTTKENVPRVQDMVNTYKEGKEMLEELSKKEPLFNSEDVVYGYVAYLSNASIEQVKSIYSEEELNKIQSIALALKFNVSTTEEELEQMKDKEYAIKRLGLSNYTIIDEIVNSHKND